MRIRKTSELEFQHLKFLIYGQSGVGKTYLAKTTPDPSRTLILSFETGLLSLKDFGIDYIDMLVDDKEAPINDNEKIKTWAHAYNILKTPAIMEAYDWIFIDSITEVSTQLHRILFPKYELDKSIDQRLYNEFFIKMRNFVKSFLELPYNVVVLALPTEDQHQSIRVDVYGKLKTMLPAFFDEVFYYIKTDTADEAEDKRALLTSTTRNIIAKDRSGKLDKFEEPNLTQIYNKIFDTKKT